MSQRKIMSKLSGVNIRFYTGLFTTILAVIMMWQLPNSQTSGISMKPEIGGDIFSTLRIIVALCFSPGDHSDKIAKRFFACYDQAPGKALFVSCQKKVYGVPLDSKAHIDTSCQNSQKIPQYELMKYELQHEFFHKFQYAMCIQRKFRKAGISMPIAVTLVNVCMGKVLGL